MVAKHASAPLSINLERLKHDLSELARIGRDDNDHGIYRMAFTDADMRARRWLEERMRAAGMTARSDGAGNVIGKWPAHLDQPSLMIGSHTDSVPCGGHLDGSLGVVAGLEVVRCMSDAGVEPQRPIEVVSFSDEEGRFGGMFGSQAFVGDCSPESILSSTDLHGVRLSEAMKRQGFDPLGALDARRSPGSIFAYLEIHIEQGPVLDQSHCAIGVVEKITGLFRWSVQIKGKANHAGTTPMSMRRDAFLGLAEFANEIPRLLEEIGSEDSRATIGNVVLTPGAANTIPGTAEFSLDVRDTSSDALNELRDAVRKTLSAIARRRDLHFNFEEVSLIEPVACATDLVETLDRHARQLGHKCLRLPSGAAHDAQIIASMAPVGMLFIPSKDGRSHSPAEWSSWQDIEAGVGTLLHASAELATSLS